MNFRRALKMLQRLGLAVATTAPIAIVAPAPSQATPPPQIITSIGSRRPQTIIVARIGENSQRYSDW